VNEKGVGGEKGRDFGVEGERRRERGRELGEGG